VRILISAGEASGEMYGAQLIEALQREIGGTGSAADQDIAFQSRGASLRRTGECTGSHLVSGTTQVEFFGVGGEKMRAAGCDIIVDSQDLAVVGITEIVSHLPKIWGLFQKLIAEADRRKPDLAVVIDSPAFNWRIARQMKKRGIPVVYYVCPQFWAWRRGRVRLLRKYVDRALVIFPFEEKFYCDRGVDAEFVGHPLAEIERPTIARDQYATENGLVASRPWITLMPGSRVKEVRMNLRGMLWAAEILGPEYDFLIPVAPTVPSALISELMHRNDPAIAPIHLVPEALPALVHSRAGIIASGTATVEAAMMDLAFVMVYRVTPLTYWLGRSTVKVPYFAMVNLIAGEKIVPELVQDDFTPEKIVAELKRIISDGEPRAKMLAGLSNVRALLRGPERPSAHPADRAAKAVVALWQNRIDRRADKSL
jgi:lipid-A-disaccharide synthase